MKALTALTGILLLAPLAHAADAPSTAPAKLTATTGQATPLPAEVQSKLRPLFDGHSLDGWIQEPLHATTLTGGSITPDLITTLFTHKDSVSAFLADHLDDAGKAALAALATAAPTTGPASAATKQAKNDLAKSFNFLILGPSLFDAPRFQSVTPREETAALLKQAPTATDSLARLNRILLEDALPAALPPSPAANWIVKDDDGSTLASTGAGRGTLYTKDDFAHYRLLFDIRHVSGKPDHQACVLVFCTRPAPGDKGMDALGGVQFQVPNGGHWDYRKGFNNGGKNFANLLKPAFNNHEWARVEILVDAATGSARMAVAQPPGTRAVEVLDFLDPAAGRPGPIALQMHNAGLFDEYRNLQLEPDPSTNDLLTTR